MKNYALLASLFCASAFAENPCEKFVHANRADLHKPFPYHQVRGEHFRPALETAMKAVHATVAEVAASSDDPTFANTVTPILAQVAHFDRTASLRLLWDDGDEPLASIDDLKIERANIIFPVYERLLAIQKRSDLTAEQKFITRDLIQRCEREGIALPSEVKAKIAALDLQLLQKKDAFQKNYQKALQRTIFFSAATSFEEGMPDDALSKARNLATKSGRDGYLFLLKPENIDNTHFVLQYARDENVRRQMFTAFSERTQVADTDNSAITMEIINLRLQRAQLLGFKNFADMILPRTMAGSVENLTAFVQTVKPHFLRMADEEMAEISALKMQLTGSSELPPWDVQYYAKKLEIQKLAWDISQVRPYLEINGALTRSLAVLEKIHGIHFKREWRTPTWHPDVLVYSVTEAHTGRRMGNFFLDLMFRAGKSSASFANEMTLPGLYSTTDGLPTRLLSDVVVNMGVAKGEEGQPTFLNYRQLQSLFHEIGHAVHSLSTRNTFGMYGMESIPRDVVELPSQLMENWLYQAEVIQQIGRHYATGEPFPLAWVDKLKMSRTIQPALKTLARRGIMTEMDLAWHTITEPITVPAQVYELSHQQDWLSHPYLRAFSGTATLHPYAFMYEGYESQFHGYQWSEVLDYDAFELFQSNGLFNPATGIRFRERFLSLGSVMDPNAAFTDFRGRPADWLAIVRKFGQLVQ